MGIRASAVVLAILATQGAFRWSADRRLAWDDYRAQPDLSSPASAMTVYAVAFNDGCTDDKYWQTVSLEFLPDKSWVKFEALYQRNPRVLAHEQSHFDLAEVHVRRIRRAVLSLAQPCDMGHEARDRIAQKIVQADRDDQKRYDQETAFGVDSGKQAEWTRRIDRELAALASYARK